MRKLSYIVVCMLIIITTAALLHNNPEMSNSGKSNTEKTLSQKSTTPDRDVKSHRDIRADSPEEVISPIQTEAMRVYSNSDDLVPQIFPEAQVLEEEIIHDEQGVPAKRVRIIEIEGKYPLARIVEPIPFKRSHQAAMVADHLVVKRSAECTHEHFTQLMTQQNLYVRRNYKEQGLYLISFNRQQFEEAQRFLTASPLITYAEPDFFATATDLPDHYVDRSKQHTDTKYSKIAPTSQDSSANQKHPNDPEQYHCYGMHNTGQTHQLVGSPQPRAGIPDADIDAPEAWSISTGDPNLLIGVIDSGIFPYHSDIADNLYKNPSEIPDNGIDDDKNGYVDDYHGFDFNLDSHNIFDERGHGTHVAGTIAARGDNNVHVSGICWSSQVINLRWIDMRGRGVASDAAEAIRYANKLNIVITNNSWRLRSGIDPSYIVRDAISEANDKGYLFVTAAGNYFDNIDEVPLFPANYDLDNILVVGATNHGDGFAVWNESSGWASNYGAQNVDLAAAGADVVSLRASGGIIAKNGTSMACPHVAGAAALIKSIRPDLKAVHIKEIIMATVDPVAEWQGKSVTGGRLNAHAALLMAQSYDSDSGNNPQPDRRDIGLSIVPNEYPVWTPTLNGAQADLLSNDWHWWHTFPSGSQTLQFVSEPTNVN